MANTITTPNMLLPNPVPGVDPGPDYANNIAASLNIIDGHNHSSGSGVQIGVSGLNINNTLPMGGYGTINQQSVGLVALASPLSSSILDTLYCSGVDLYFNDGNGNQVQITASGTVNATSSGISSGTATASFSAGVLVVNAASLTPANIQCASIKLGNNVASSNFLTLAPPNSMAANFGLVLPSIPGAQSFLALDTSGNITAYASVSGGITGGMIAGSTITGSNIASQTIGTANIANGAIGGAQIATNAVVTVADLTVTGSATINGLVSANAGLNVVGTTVIAGSTTIEQNLVMGQQIYSPNMAGQSTSYADVGWVTSGSGVLIRITSSRRYKDNIVPLKINTAAIYNLRPVSFTWKESGHPDFGLIAEEVDEYFPQIVPKKEYDGKWLPESVNYKMLSVLLLEEMKKIRNELDELKLSLP